MTARELRERLGVSPTPDDGVRLSAETVWDESARPLAPGAGPGRELHRVGPLLRP